MNSVVMIDVGGKPHRTLPKDVAVPPGHQPPDPCRFPAHRRAQPRSPSRCRCASTMKKPRRASSAAACSTSSATSSSWSATRPSIPNEIHIPLDGPRHRRFDPHQPGQAARGRQVRDRRPRLHRRHHRRSVGDEVRRAKRPQRRPRSRPSRARKLPKAKAAKPRRRRRRGLILASFATVNEAASPLAGRAVFAGDVRQRAPMQLWVGLGNPGAQYALQRHNVGFMAVDTIAEVHDFGPWQKKFRGLDRGRPHRRRSASCCSSPQTFMNDSGDAVSEALDFYKLDLGRRSPSSTTSSISRRSRSR